MYELTSCYTSEINVPANKRFTFSADENLLREEQIVRPFDNLLIRVARILGTERRVAHDAFKHDRSK
jgi:hypothetical protein